jgi:hypothetical protein
MEIPLRRALRASGLLLIGLVACLASLTAATAQAQGQAGVSISPALIEEPLDPGAKKEYTVTIKNLNDYEQKFYLSTQDIVDVQDGGTPVFADGSLEKTGMELAGWISLGVTEITLPAGVSERVTFTLQVPGDATPGSHFGSVFISVDAQLDTRLPTSSVFVLRVMPMKGQTSDSFRLRSFFMALKM